MTTFTLPLWYRVFFLTIEPIACVVGAYFAYSKPRGYLDMTVASSGYSNDLDLLPVATTIALSQLANLYAAFAINEALVLRCTSDLRVWRTLLLRLLIADFGHLYTVFPLGPAVYWDVAKWTAMDWGNVGFVYVGASTRICFLCGLGLPKRRLQTGGTPSKRVASRE